MLSYETYSAYSLERKDRFHSTGGAVFFRGNVSNDRSHPYIRYFGLGDDCPCKRVYNNSFTFKLRGDW